MNSAIIGCGNIYQNHAQTLIDNNDTDLLFVSDCICERAKDAAKKYKCSYSYDYHEVLDNDEIDVAHICTPH